MLTKLNSCISKITQLLVRVTSLIQRVLSGVAYFVAGNSVDFGRKANNVTRQATQKANTSPFNRFSFLCTNFKILSVIDNVYLGGSPLSLVDVCPIPPNESHLNIYS